MDNLTQFNNGLWVFSMDSIFESMPDVLTLSTSANYAISVPLRVYLRRPIVPVQFAVDAPFL